MKRFLLASLLGALCGASAWAATEAPPSFNRQTTVLGQTFGVGYTTAANAAQTGISTALNATILGKQKSLIQASVQPTTGFSQGDLVIYVGGVQISATQGSFVQGTWSHQFTIPPLNVSGTIVSIPIGPIVVEVDGGYSLSGGLDTTLSLNIEEGQSATPSSIQASIDATIAAAGFVQGSVNLLVIRGGLEGQIDAAEGTVSTQANLYLGTAPPSFSATGGLGFFGGSVSAFADYYALFGWNRFWSATLFQWNGLCFDFNNGVQVGGKCPAAL